MMWFYFLFLVVTSSIHFAAEREAAGMTINQLIKSEAMVLVWGANSGDEILPQVMELKHLRILFTSVGRVVCNDKDAELIFQKEKSPECESEADDLSFNLVEHK